MKKIGLFLILILAIFLFLFKTSIKNFSSTYAQSNNKCQIDGGGYSNGNIYFEPGKIFYIESESSVCKYIEAQIFDVWVFKKENDNKLIISRESSDENNRNLNRTYFVCNEQGQWKEKEMENEYFCSSDNIIFELNQALQSNKDNPTVSFFKINETPTSIATDGGDIQRTLMDIGNLSTQQTECKIGDKCCSIEGINLHINPPSLPPPFDLVVNFGTGAVNSLLDLTINKVSGEFENFLMSIFGVQQKTYCQTGTPSSSDREKCYCQGKNRVLSNLCSNISNEDERKQCLTCVGGGNSELEVKGVWTAIGCITGDLSSFIKEKIFGWGVGLAGIIALLCIIYSAFQIQTSAGNAEKIKKAQELLTSCIMGLMLIIFSVFILRLIGVDILRIPGFGR